MVRSYIERTYCDRFAQHGWVYGDGTLSIKAQIWFMHAGTCSESRIGGPTVTVPVRAHVRPIRVRSSSLRP